MTHTIHELATIWDVEKDIAAGLVRFLVAKDLAKFRGERPNPSGKGKGQHVYAIVSWAGASMKGLIQGVEG